MVDPDERNPDDEIDFTEKLPDPSETEELTRKRPTPDAGELGPGIEPGQRSGPPEGEFGESPGLKLEKDLESIGFSEERSQTHDVQYGGFEMEPIGGDPIPTEGVATEGVGTESIGTEGVGTERVGSESFATEGMHDDQNQQDDSDEVLVLLDDDGDDMADGFTREVGLSRESLEGVGLRTSNPLEVSPDDATEDIDEALSVGTMSDAPAGVGVIDEITELASSLDPEILGADDDVGTEAIGGYEADEGYDTYYDDGMGYDYGPEPRSRGGVFATFAALALIGAGGFFAYLKYMEMFGPWDRTPQTASASGIGDGPDVGTTEGPGVGPSSGGTDPGTTVIEPQTWPSRSKTREAVRESVLLAMELGVQWEDPKE